LVKNSFTLIETLISITLLIIVISGFFYSSYYDEKNNKNFMLLNDLENKFSTQNYNNLTKTSTQIQIVKNKETTDYISVSKYTFENDEIKIFKYEK
jgi:uncharacterized protein YpuA (DUF1002 family)